MQRDRLGTVNSVEERSNSGKANGVLEVDEFNEFVFMGGQGGRLYAVRLARDGAPVPLAPKGEWRAECREENDRRYSGSARVPVCEPLCAALWGRRIRGDLLESKSACHGFVGRCWQIAKTLLSGLRIAPVSARSGQSIFGSAKLKEFYSKCKKRELCRTRR